MCLVIYFNGAATENGASPPSAFSARPDTQGHTILCRGANPRPSGTLVTWGVRVPASHFGVMVPAPRFGVRGAPWCWQGSCWEPECSPTQTCTTRGRSWGQQQDKAVSLCRRVSWCLEEHRSQQRPRLHTHKGCLCTESSRSTKTHLNTHTGAAARPDGIYNPC